MRSRYAVFAVIFLSILTSALADDLTVIRLRSRPAETLVPLLRSMYGPKATIAGSGMKLFVAAPPEIVADIKQVLGELDGTPRMLRVAIRGAGTGAQKSSQAGVNGNLNAGPVHVGVNNRLPAGVTLKDSSSAQQSSGERYVMVEEGVPATINDPGGGSQFVVRVEGDTATVQVVNSSLNAQTPSLGTTTSAGVGQWMPLGGVSQSSTGSGSQLLSGSSASNQSSQQLSVKVDVVNSN